MREIVLDTETTGFDPQGGDRIVEIGAVELIGHVATGNTYHQYINPERSTQTLSWVAGVAGCALPSFRHRQRIAHAARGFA